MKKIFFLLLTSTLLFSCSEYQKVLNKGKVADQYKLAEKLFNEGKYNRAITLFDKVTPAFTNKPQLQRILFMVAKSNFETKNYELSSYYFNKFINNYPKSSKIEDATYFIAQSYYMLSPRYSLDQKDTTKALESLQNFIDRYPNSEFTSKANKQYQDLKFKLEKKAFEIAKQYLTTEKYNAAIVAFDNFVQEYLGTKFKEDALFLKFKAAHILATKSVDYKKEERYTTALKYYQKFAKYYPKSNYIKEANSLFEIDTKNLEKIKK